MQSSSLDQLMAQIESKYTVETVPLKIGNKTLKVLQLKDFESYIESLVETQSVGIMDLPFWAKIWDSSFMLAYFLGKQPVVPGQRILEIGTGIGILGIYVALCGHNITITDNNEDALLFARANAFLNGCPEVDIRKMDWTDPGLFYPYDMIVGSEVIYDRNSYPALVKFLRKALAPEGIIFLAKHADLKAPAFFTELTKLFKFKQTIQTIRSDGEAQQIALYAIRPKEENLVYGHA